MKLKLLKLLSGILLLGLVISAPAIYAESKSSGPTVEELAKTPAAKAYISKRYQESLTEFQKLEEQYPFSVLIKRYIASLYDSLGDRGKAVEKLEEAVLFDNEDLVTHQMLGEFYIKQKRFSEAETEFQFIADDVKKDDNTAAYAAKRIADLRKIQAMPQTLEGKRLGTQEFMKSEPAKAFAAGRYGEALKGFDALIEKYPEDILLHRFKGMTLTRMGEPDKAIQVFQEALLLDVDSAALHYYLGEAYFEKGLKEESRKEYQWVIEHDEAAYRTKAQRALFQSLGQGSIQYKQKRWNFTGIGGYEYDTNATYKSRDENFSSAGDQNSGRYLTTLFGNYRMYEKKRFSVSSDAVYSQALYNDFPNLQTFTFGGGLSALYGFTFLSKPVYFNLRDGVTETLLKNRYYLWSNTLSPSLVFIPHPRVNTTVFYRWAYNRYAQKVNTNTPEFFSRTGYGNTIGILNTFYFNDKKNLYTTLGYDFEHASTKGTEYRKNAHGVSLLLHAPLVEKIEAETVFRFRDSDYPKSFLPLQRRDELFSLTCTLSRPLTQNLTLLSYYTYENTKARNNLYEYYKHVFGVQLLLRY